MNLDWQADALCAQMPIDFHADNYADARLAKKVCQLCTVRPECLAYALAHDERWGVWGGESETALRSMQAETRDEDTAAAVEELLEPEDERAVA